MTRFIKLTRNNDSGCCIRLNANVIAHYSKSNSNDSTLIQLIPLEFSSGSADNYLMVKESVEQIDDMLGVDFE